MLDQRERLESAAISATVGSDNATTAYGADDNATFAANGTSHDAATEGAIDPDLLNTASSVDSTLIPEADSAENSIFEDFIDFNNSTSVDNLNTLEDVLQNNSSSRSLTTSSCWNRYIELLFSIIRLGLGVSVG